jgi:hypothetical protein
VDEASYFPTRRAGRPLRGRGFRFSVSGSWFPVQDSGVWWRAVELHHDSADDEFVRGLRLAARVAPGEAPPKRR